MHFSLQSRTLFLLLAVLAVSAEGLQVCADGQLVEQPVGEASETCEAELELESEFKDAVDPLLAGCPILQSSGFDAHPLDVPTLEESMRVVLEQNAARPPPVLFDRVSFYS